MITQCSKCHKKFKADDLIKGRKVRCPNCNQYFVAIDTRVATSSISPKSTVSAEDHPKTVPSLAEQVSNDVAAVNDDNYQLSLMELVASYCDLLHRAKKDGKIGFIVACSLTPLWLFIFIVSLIKVDTSMTAGAIGIMVVQAIMISFSYKLWKNPTRTLVIISMLSNIVLSIIYVIAFGIALNYGYIALGVLIWFPLWIARAEYNRMLSATMRQYDNYNFESELIEIVEQILDTIRNGETKNISLTGSKPWQGYLLERYGVFTSVVRVDGPYTFKPKVTKYLFLEREEVIIKVKKKLLGKYFFVDLYLHGIHSSGTISYKDIQKLNEWKSESSSLSGS